MSTATLTKTTEQLIAEDNGQPRTIAQWCDRTGKKYSTVRLALNKLVAEGIVIKSEEDGVAYFGVRGPTPVNYSLSIDGDGNSTLTFVIDGDVTTITTDHPNFGRVVDALAKGEDPSECVDFEAAVEQIAEVDDRIEVADDAVYFNGEAVHSNLLDSFVRYKGEGRDVGNLVLFLERLQANPRARAREELFNWTQARDLTIDETGCFIGYKAVRNRFTPPLDGAEHPFDGYAYESISSGPAIVNGIHHEHGPVPQNVGSVVELGREVVDENDRVLCSNGLHVGDYSYASGFGPILMEVRVAPEDVVTVPDSYDSKLRCCKYEVLAIHDRNKGDDLSDYEPPATWSSQEFEETLAQADIPKGFRAKLRARLGRKNRVVED